MENTSGALIRQRRIQLGLTQKQLADMLECSQPNVRKIENGSIPDVVIGIKLEKVLGVLLEDLFFNAKYQLPAQSVMQGHSVYASEHKTYEAEIQEVIKLMEKTDKEGRSMILQAAKIANHTRTVQLFELEKMKPDLRQSSADIRAQINRIGSIDDADQTNDDQPNYVAPSQPRGSR